MADETPLQSWPSILNSVKTPLGFFSLIALVLDAILLALAAKGEVSIYAPIGLLLVLIVGVITIVMVKPLALYHPADWPKSTPKPVVMVVTLIFPEGIAPFEVDFDTETCTIDVRDIFNQQKYQGPPNITRGEGGWALRLPQSLEEGDNVRLSLVDTDGGSWRVSPFNPFATSQRLTLVKRR